MDNKFKAQEIYDYMTHCLANGVYISKTNEKLMVKEIKFMLEND